MARFASKVLSSIRRAFGQPVEPLREVHIFTAGIDKDEGKFRPLTSQRERELSPLTHQRVLNLVYYLYETNPLAHRIIESTKDFIVGEGITFHAQDSEVARVLTSFWDDPVNLWDLKQHNKAMELCLYGEQCYPAFVNPQSGRVRLGYVDPLEIKEVVTDPDNCEALVAVILKSRAGQPERHLKVIRQEEDPASPFFGRFTGDCFYFAINKVSNARRGRSDLLALIDWIDAYDQFLFSRAERANLLNAFVWDVKLEGFNEEQIQSWLKANATPKPGSLRAHNEKVEWKALAPVLAAHDASEEARLIKNHILGGAGLPEHWFGEGGNVNRATALEMGEPTLKRLTARQRYFRHLVEYIFRFVLDQAVIAGALSEKNDLTFSLAMPEISVRDLNKAAATLNQVANSLTVAERQSWVTKNTARKLFGLVASHLGAEVDAQAEEAELMAEAERSQRTNDKRLTTNDKLTEFAAKETGLNPEKREQRIAAMHLAAPGLALDLYKGKGHSTKIYQSYFRKVVTVDKDPAAHANYLMDNSEFVERELNKYLDFSFIDFDAWGSPAPLIQQFFAKIKEKKLAPFVLALTDGALLAARIHGAMNLGKYYLVGEDEPTKATSEIYENFEDLIRGFIQKVSRQNGFQAKEINMVRNSFGSAIYAAFEISP